jgi:hypothetical protein
MRWLTRLWATSRRNLSSSFPDQERLFCSTLCLLRYLQHVPPSHESPKQCCVSGSGIRCLFDPGPGSKIQNRFFSRSRISTPYFLKLSDKFLGKKFYNSLKTGPNFFLQHLKNKIIFNFVKFVATKKGLTTIFFLHHSLLLLF